MTSFAFIFLRLWGS